MVKVVSDTEPAVKELVWKDELSALATGAITGVVTWVVAYALNKYVIGTIACRTGSSIISCGDAGVVSAALALIVASIVGLTLLVRQRIFRPLLVVLAAAISLWGIDGSWLNEQSILNFLLTVLLMAVVYLVFGWFTKLRQFWIAAVISVVLVISFRLIITL